MITLINLDLLPYEYRMNPGSDKTAICKELIETRREYKREYDRLVKLVARRERAFNNAVRDCVAGGTIPTTVQWLGSNAISPRKLPYSVFRKAQLLQSAVDATNALALTAIASRQFI
jgi:hypothetical protein